MTQMNPSWGHSLLCYIMLWFITYDISCTEVIYMYFYNIVKMFSHNMEMEWFPVIIISPRL